MNKFREAEEKLLISKYTEEEFLSTIMYYVDDIGRNISPRVSSSVFLQFSNHSEFYEYYFEWKKDRSNNNLKLFQAHLETLYESFKNRYRIQVVNRIGFNDLDENYIEKIDEIADSIFSFKRLNSYNPDKISDKSIEVDAKNIGLIDEKREDKNKNIFETKDYLISTDHQLKKWDMERKASVPTVILPSQWLTILLRYHNRTNDDFKSFVSFLNLSNSESLINNKTLTSVLNGISEITADTEKQSLIISKLVDNKFKEIIKGGESEEEIQEIAKIYAKTTLEKRLEELEFKTQEIESNLEEKEKLIEKKQKELLETNRRKKEETKNNDGLINTTVNAKLETWQNNGNWFLFFSIICGMLFILSFIDVIFNPIYHLKNLVNNLPAESYERTAAFTAMYAVSAIGFMYFLIKFYNRRFNQDQIEDKREKLYSKYRAR